MCLEHVFRRSLQESDTVVALAPNGSGNDACAWAFEAQPYSALAPHGSGTGAHEEAFKAQRTECTAACLLLLTLLRLPLPPADAVAAAAAYTLQKVMPS